MTCPLAGLYAGQLDFSAPHRAKKANTKSKAPDLPAHTQRGDPSWPNGVAFKEVSSPHDCQSTLVFAKTLGEAVTVSAWHCLAWLIRFCGGINSGSINCGSQHGIAWLG